MFGFSCAGNDGVTSHLRTRKKNTKKRWQRKVFGPVCGFSIELPLAVHWIKMNNTNVKKKHAEFNVIAMTVDCEHRIMKMPKKKYSFDNG